MQKELIQLKKLFVDIKNQGLHKSVCKGNAGIGQTFESLLGKKADASPSPDYNGIEIKTKLGYSKSPLTLLSLTPQSDFERPLEFLVDNFGYPESHFSEFKVLKAEACSEKKRLTANRYYFILVVDRINNKIRIVIQNKSGKVLNNDLYWDFDVLKNRLLNKLNYMALVIGYPYYIKHQVYYKYFKILFYKLKGFECFLSLIEKGIVTVVFNIDICKDGIYYGKIKDHGTAFKIDKENIWKLFRTLNI